MIHVGVSSRFGVQGEAEENKLTYSAGLLEFDFREVFEGGGDRGY